MSLGRSSRFPSQRWALSDVRHHGQISHRLTTMVNIVPSKPPVVFPSERRMLGALGERAAPSAASEKAASHSPGAAHRHLSHDALQGRDRRARCHAWHVPSNTRGDGPRRRLQRLGCRRQGRPQAAGPGAGATASPVTPEEARRSLGRLTLSSHRGTQRAARARQPGRDAGQCRGARASGGTPEPHSRRSCCRPGDQR